MDQIHSSPCWVCTGFFDGNLRCFECPAPMPFLTFKWFDPVEQMAFGVVGFGELYASQKVEV